MVDLVTGQVTRTVSAGDGVEILSHYRSAIWRGISVGSGMHIEELSRIPLSSCGPSYIHPRATALDQRHHAAAQRTAQSADSVVQNEWAVGGDAERHEIGRPALPTYRQRLPVHRPSDDLPERGYLPPDPLAANGEPYPSAGRPA
jgi:hypothetical protein